MVGAALVVFLLLAWLQRDVWKWVERASWVIALVLFPAAIYQLVVLQRDQRRLADQLTKKPDVRVGRRILPPNSVPGTIPRIELQFVVAPQWQEGAALSDVVKIPVEAVNVGNRTAHNVLVNIVFPKLVHFVAGPAAVEVRDEPDFDRWRLMFREHPTIHIGVTMDLAVSVRIAAELANGFPLGVNVSTEDTPYTNSILFVAYEHGVGLAAQ
jgi:hypothetical protein